MSLPPPISAEQWASLPPEFQVLLRAVIEYYEGRIAELEARLAKTPQNSSLPPSSQHPHAKPDRRKSKPKRRRGGQPGHQKHERPLLPTDQCDELHSLKPTECRRCGEPLRGRDPEPLRQQVWELPEIEPHVTEYQRHRLTCRFCGETTCAELPCGVPQGQSGPRLLAFTALLMAYFRQSKRWTAEFLAALMGQPCSPALAVKMQTQVTAALRPSYDSLVARLSTGSTIATARSAARPYNVAWRPSAARWSGCCCAGCKAAIGRWWACAGNCTSIAPGSGHLSASRASNRPTTPANGPYVTP